MTTMLMVRMDGVTKVAAEVAAEVEECGGCGSGECDDPSCEDRRLERDDEEERS
jgi:hypothetical protein